MQDNIKEGGSGYFSNFSPKLMHEHVIYVKHNWNVRC